MDVYACIYYPDFDGIISCAAPFESESRIGDNQDTADRSRVNRTVGNHFPARYCGISIGILTIIAKRDFFLSGLSKATANKGR